MTDVKQVVEMLLPHGAMAEKIPNFKVRQEQITMAEAVAQTALEEQGTAVIEAGTGTGKTFAYLVPALQLGEKVIISTGTRNLQNQLFHKDLPVVRSLLDRPLRVALLKGRANYLCQYRLEQHRFVHHMLSRHQIRLLSKIEKWAQKTSKGDISELAELPETDPVWSLATSSADNCLGQECPYFDECHLNKARAEALKADVVVINHHLFFADAMMREEGFGELLPSADLVILDEAHQLAEVASRFFGMTLSSRKIKRLCSDIEAEVQESAADMADLLDQAAEIPPIVDQMQSALQQVFSDKGAWLDIADEPSIAEATKALGDGLHALSESMREAGVRSRGLLSCQRRLTDMLALYRAIMLQSRGDDSQEASDTFVDNYVQWYERYKASFVIHSTPLSVAEPFTLYRQQFQASWVFTSATLSVNNSFESFETPLGLEPTLRLQLASPFNYEHQARLYVPNGLPAPRERGYTQAVVEQAIPLIQLMQGRTFMLFTSHSALQEAAKLLEGELDFPVLIQGEMGKAELLNRFRELGNAVLLATGDFWEGVDVRGEALSCVIIDKLPFASPGEPVVQAKIDRIRSQGGNPFISFQVPAATISLKQGVGRLIRDVSDRGLMVICDPRLVNSRYGVIFQRSLPPMPLVRTWTDVVSFVESMHQSVEAFH